MKWGSGGEAPAKNYISFSLFSGKRGGQENNLVSSRGEVLQKIFAFLNIFERVNPIKINEIRTKPYP